MISYRQIKNHQYISFDVFDTLLKRSVAQPSDLFALMEMMGAPHGFAHKRMQAEHATWEKLGRPVTLEEIYTELREREGDAFAQMKELELELELSGCTENPTCAELLRQCVEAGKTVILISDMYLSSATIGAMLEKCGIRGYKKLYVSCEYGVNKRSGGLYEAVLKELGIQPRQLVHIGDHRKADFLRPMAMGVHAIWERNDQRKMCRIPRKISADSALIQRTIQACVRNASAGLDEVERHGCEIFGPMLYGFTVWLAEQLRKDDIHDIYFLAREGLIMKRAFDELRLPEMKTHYLYCSRRSLTVPIIWKYESFEDVLHLVSHIEKITLQEFVARVGLNADDYEELANQLHLKMNKKYLANEFTKDPEIRKFYEAIQGDIYINSKKEFEAVCNYMEAQHMGKSIAFVDIGDHGTAQGAFVDLAATASWEIRVKGYYIGIANKASNFLNEKLSGSGYIYDLSSKGERLENERKYFIPVYEAPFMATHGSVKRFVMKEGKGVPEFCASEYEENEGRIINEVQYIGGIQNGGMAFVRYMLAAFSRNLLSLPAEVAFAALSRVGLSPTLAEAEMWGNCRFVNFGQKRWLATPKSFGFYIFHPGQLYRDYSLSPWKIGFMKRLLKVPMPYVRMDAALRRLKNWKKQ